MQISLDEDFELTVPKVPLPRILEDVRGRASEVQSRRVEKFGFINRFKRLLRIPGGWRLEDYVSLNAEKYFEDLKTEFRHSVRALKDNLVAQVSLAIDSACTKYLQVMEEKLNERRLLIAKLEADRRSNDQIKHQYEIHAQRARQAQSMIDECKRVEGDI